MSRPSSWCGCCANVNEVFFSHFSFMFFAPTKESPDGNVANQPSERDTHLIDWKNTLTKPVLLLAPFPTLAQTETRERERERLKLNGQGCRTNRNGSEIEMILICFLGSSSPS